MADNPFRKVRLHLPARYAASPAETVRSAPERDWMFVGERLHFFAVFDMGPPLPAPWPG